MSQAALPCIVCDKPMTRVMDGGYEWQPNDGVGCSTPGNYGSTVFDSTLGDHRLHFVICDACLKAKASSILWLRHARPVMAIDPDSDFKSPVVVGFEPLDREAVPWNPSLDYEDGDSDELHVEWADIGTKMGRIDWRI